MNKCGKLWRQQGVVAAPSGAHCDGGEANHGGVAARLQACSACAGDYEDPDRTAWTPDEPGGEEREDERAERFPAEEQ